LQYAEEKNVPVEFAMQMEQETQAGGDDE